MTKAKFLIISLILGAIGLGIFLTQGQYQFSFQSQPSWELLRPVGGPFKNLFSWPLSFGKKPGNPQKTLEHLFASPGFQSQSGPGHKNSAQVDQTNEKEKSQIQDYLVASSEIGFPEPWQVSEVIALAYRGQREHLKNLTTVLKEKLDKFEALAPPSSLENFHQESLQIISRYIELLEKAASSLTPTELTQVLNSQAFNNLRAQAKDLIENLKSFINQQQIEIPEQVLPKDEIPE